MQTPNSTRDVMKSAFGMAAPGGPSDKDRGVAAPPLQKPSVLEARRVDLPPIDGTFAPPRRDVVEVMASRRSRRRFGEAAIRLEDLAFLLWATAGVQRVVGNVCTMRTVPSAGARHPYETYLIVRAVEELEAGAGPADADIARRGSSPAAQGAVTPAGRTRAGLWRYLPLSHQVELLRAEADLPARMAQACGNQAFLAEAAVTFVWAAVPYRAKWAYGAASAKAMLIDAGHIAQNLYLAAEALNLGTCAIGAYDQAKLDALLGLDGQEEFAVYLAPVGAKKRGK